MEEKSVEITNLDQQALNFQTSFVALVQLGLVVIYLMKEVHQAAALWWVHRLCHMAETTSRESCLCYTTGTSVMVGISP